MDLFFLQWLSRALGVTQDRWSDWGGALGSSDLENQLTSGPAEVIANVTEVGSGEDSSVVAQAAEAEGKIRAWE